MSDTLREALDRQAAEWMDSANELAAGATGLAASISAEAFITAATRLRTILAAHPDNSTVECGVRWNGEDEVIEYQPSDKATVTSAFKADIAWAKRNAIKTPPKGELVSRQVTPWEVAK